MKNISKKGISLLVLIITIVVALIILSVTVISTVTAIDNSTVTTFTKDLTEIKDATETYYVNNNEVPTNDLSNPMDLSYIMNNLINQKSQSFKDLFVNELQGNGDNLDTTKFYKVSLSKINITKATYGMDTTNPSDIIIVSYPNLNIYYLDGVAAKGTTYFSLSKTTNVVNESADKSTTSVISSGGINITKINGWTNVMGLNLDVNMSDGEQLRVLLNGGTEKVITTITGNNTFKYNSISDIATTPIFTPMEISNFLNTSIISYNNRYITFSKYNSSGTNLGSVRVDLSNYDITLPSKDTSNDVLSSYTNMNSIKITLSDDASGVKEVRYEYLNKYNDSAVATSYYTGVTDFDNTYMKTKARLAAITSDSNVTTITAPKDVKTLKVAIIDNAGNVYSYNQEIIPSIYIGYVIDNVTDDAVKLTVNMYSPNGIKTLDVSKSYDGVNFTGNQVFNLNTSNIAGVVSKQVTFSDFTSSKVYLKVYANTNVASPKIETKIININLTSNVNSVVPQAWGGSIDKVVDLGVPIPKGFYYVGGSCNKGLVISDNSADFNKGADATLIGNQFVWVPVKDGLGTDGAYTDTNTIQYKRWCTSGSSYTFKVDDTLPTDVTSETSQITRYGGFYVGRYIASLDYNGGATRAMSKKGTNVTTEAYWGIPSGAAGTGYLWNNINWSDSKAKAQAMYTSVNSTSVRSGLLTGKMWDTTMRWIELSGKSVTDSRSWGNYSDSIAPANVALPSTIKRAGYSELWKANNIYDMAGNVRQYTSELNYYSPSTNAIARTSNWANSGSAQPASYRDIVMTTGYGEWYTGFRVALYIL